MKLKNIVENANITPPLAASNALVNPQRITYSNYPEASMGGHNMDSSNNSELSYTSGIPADPKHREYFGVSTSSE